MLFQREQQFSTRILTYEYEPADGLYTRSPDNDCRLQEGSPGCNLKNTGSRKDTSKWLSRSDVQRDKFCVAGDLSIE